MIQDEDFMPPSLEQIIALGIIGVLSIIGAIIALIAIAI